jgi:hypothetical protein
MVHIFYCSGAANEQECYFQRLVSVQGIFVLCLADFKFPHALINEESLNEDLVAE